MVPGGVWSLSSHSTSQQEMVVDYLGISDKNKCLGSAEIQYGKDLGRSLGVRQSDIHYQVHDKKYVFIY